MENKKTKPKKADTPHPPLKPKHPDVEGSPDDKDPNAQYEDKNES